MGGPKDEITLIRNSSNHAERIRQAHVRRMEYKTAKEKFLEEKGIDEEELFAWGYKIWTGLWSAPGRDDEETYKVCYSMTGNEIKRFTYVGGDVFEEERMVDIAKNIASTLKVDVNHIARTKPPESINKK